ncbi:hypothetical protein LPJ54_002128 [Coemansia sp. RSA 1824]|nr:hypothetical protein LPJ54_002128 [Coemansia sp. RSA 1824]
MVWQPMVPLYIADSVLQLTRIAEVMLDSYILHCLDFSGAHPTYHAFGAAFLLLVVKFVNLQGSQIELLICQEWNRVVKALELEFFRMPLRDDGLRNPITTNFGKGNLMMFIENLRSIQSASSQLIALTAAVLPVYRQIGVLMAVPFCLSVGKMVLNFAVAQVTGGRNVHLEKCSSGHDSIGELHRGIRAVKMFGWERLYLGSRKPSKAKVCKSHMNYYIARAIWSVLNAIDNMLDHISSALIIYLYAKTGQPSSSNALSNADLFWISGMITSLRSSVFGTLYIFKSMQSTVEHYRVIERFFKGDFVKTLSQLKEQPCHVPAVFMEKCSFRWSSRAEQSVIANASICVSAGELVAVNGATGSGKSALLLSISGELEMTNGAGHIAGKVGYLEQSPWIINDTLKANIIFGRDYNPMLYKQVIHACAFAEDLQMWPEGDLTIIGDRGINISGGQRARLALARTLYSQADIYVLDDPLSAVDAHVRRHIMENVILDTGMLAGKTRIIASNTDHIAPFANQSIIVDDGNVLSKRQVPAKYRKIQSTPPQISRHDAVYATDTHKPTTDSSSEPTPKQPAHSSVWDNVRYITDLCTLPLIIVTMVIGLVQPVASHIMDGYVLSALKPNSQLSSTDTNALLKYILLNMASQTIVGMLAKVSYCAESIIQQKYVAGKISQAFMRGVVHAPLSFFDNTSRHHLNSAYQEGVVSLASDTGRLLRSEVSVIARTCLTVFRISKNVPMLLLIAPVAAYLSAKVNRIVRPTLAALQEHIGTTSYKFCSMSDIIDSGSQLIRQAKSEPHFTRLYIDAANRHTAVASAYDGIYFMLSAMDRTLNGARDYLVLIAVLAQRWVTGRAVGSGEFIQQYADIEPEAPYVVEECKPLPSWPTRGQIEFNQFSMKYRPDMDFALKNINLVIQPGEKIGIVGRTGAGKSSLVKSLFRLIPNGTAGSITVDGQDISDIGLSDLRPRLGVIPQESMMFPGTYRENIDPLKEHSVENVWASLIKCKAAKIVAAQGAVKTNADHVRSKIQAKWQQAGMLKRLYMLATGGAPQGSADKGTSPLDKQIEGNIRLSSGQQQLFSMCRLLLRKHQIVVLDEATADVDLNTDKDIQSVINKEFGNCTVLTIAHRLETVMNSDRIVVMNKGEIVEVGPPQELIAKGGYFAELVQSSNFGASHF